MRSKIVGFDFESGKKQYGEWHSAYDLHVGDHRNGPFRMEKHNGRRRAGKNIWKVLNKKGKRVHRGTQGSCAHRVETLNVKYAEWLMTKED